MRWQSKVWREGEVRTREHFCFLPLFDWDTDTWYWLETIWITEERTDGGPEYGLEWITTKIVPME